MPHISSSEDLYGPSYVLVPAGVLAHTLSGAALASLLAPSSAFPHTSRAMHTTAQRLWHRHAPHWTAPPVASPAPTRLLWGLRLRLSDLGVR